MVAVNDGVLSTEVRRSAASRNRATDAKVPATASTSTSTSNYIRHGNIPARKNFLTASI